MITNAYQKVSPYVLEGAPLSRAFVMAGISNHSYDIWLQFYKKYERSLDDYHAEPNPVYEKYYELFKKLKRDEATWLHTVTKRGMNGPIRDNMDWRRDMSILERRDKDNWSKERKLKVEHTNKDLPPDDQYL